MQPRPTPKCRYFGTRKGKASSINVQLPFRSLKLDQGCRAGNSCLYAHDPQPLEITEAIQPQTDNRHVLLGNRGQILPSTRERDHLSSWLERVETPTPGSNQDLLNLPSRRPISRLQLENPREFQLNQVRRRFRPKESSDEDATYLTFTMVPTDPDFPHDITGLDCVLRVPMGYPGRGNPSLEVKNENLNPDLRSAVEVRFSQLVNSAVSMGLLKLVNALDRQLEDALTGKKTCPDHGKAEAINTQAANKTTTEVAVQDDDFDSRRRRREIAQLRSRLGRDRLFSTNPDGTVLIVPVRPVRPDLLPASLKQLSAVGLSVPVSYPATPCQLNISGVADEVARYVEISFDKHVRDNPGMSLIAHINYLSAMMHNMAALPEDVGLSEAVGEISLEEEMTVPEAAPVSERPVPDNSTELQEPRQMEDRPHIQIIPRPPEWGNPGDERDNGDSDYTDGSEFDHSFSEEEDEEEIEVPKAQPIQTGREVLLSFPSLELHGIELLELKSVSLTLKCERCKDTYDLQKLKIGDNGISVPPERVQICGKCSSYLTIGFRRELMHDHSNRAGILHLNGCTAVDLLPRLVITPDPSIEISNKSASVNRGLC
ncbi:predicted protein [Uncinocarpus reesii 1704]|uniref:C3H1-type domain-containing protein n=1 Tax=Uncinocarpus reesii (strain UAMH 1704) TaxID=336963 RepID=C4JGV9_UNCRE|nr:uncharacterized protein UREG_01210 [Uncinocarpus reesii 1704]EEP76361.1 predicted protein [Uncinocarpus reesii 1704]